MAAETELFAFVLMPFDKAFDDYYRLGIKEPASTLGILAERVDEQMFREGMLERIYQQINVADVIIADMTGQNPNVFYEVGYAHAKKKLCIHLTQRAEDIPFDLKHHRHIVYGSSATTLRTRLLEELTWAKTQIASQSSQIKVDMKTSTGLLETTKFSAIGSVDFTFDLHNEGTDAAPEIHAAYFYSKKGWALKQDGRECPTTESDLHDKGMRHFLTPPVRRLTPKAWAQIKFTARRTLARALDGEKLSDSYTVGGRALLRLVTADGNFDYEFPVEVTFDDMPF